MILKGSAEPAPGGPTRFRLAGPRTNPDHPAVAHHHHGTIAPGPLREGEAKRLTITLFLALLATAIEGVGGWVSHSLALLSDAGHMLADAAAIALSLFALRIGGRPADARRTYGYYRLEILAALLNGALLIAIAVDASGMWLTHARDSSMNLRSTFLHLAGDLLNSVGVLASAAIIAWTGRLEADPIISFLIAATIVWSAVRLCRDAVDVLLEGVPAHLDFSEVNQALGAVPGVAAVHDLHVWTITSGLIALSCHIVVSCEGPDCRSHDEILTDARQVLREKFRIEHTTIQFESESYQHDDVVH